MVKEQIAVVVDMRARIILLILPPAIMTVIFHLHMNMTRLHPIEGIILFLARLMMRGIRIRRAASVVVAMMHFAAMQWAEKKDI